jgi:hypothetical protein
MHSQLGMGAASMMLPQNMLAVQFDDGTTGFLDPDDGTYYDNQGNDITGYVQIFGGAKVVGPASAAAIAAAEGIPAPTSASHSTLLPGPAPRISTTPAPSTSSVNSALNWFTGATLISGVPNLAVIGGGLLVLSLIGGMGGRRRR